MGLHGPAMIYIEHVTACEDGGLEHKCQQGFPLIWEMQPLLACTVQEEKCITPKPVDELISKQDQTNRQVVSRVKFS